MTCLKHWKPLSKMAVFAIASLFFMLACGGLNQPAVDVAATVSAGVAATQQAEANLQTTVSAAVLATQTAEQATAAEPPLPPPPPAEPALSPVPDPQQVREVILAEINGAIAQDIPLLQSLYTPDAVVIDPDVHHVVMENDHVRVFEARATAGTRSPMHSHPPLVLVSIGSARGKLTLPGGEQQILDLRPGTVIWLENPEHSWELLAGELHVVAVEVKSAREAKTK